MVLAPFHFTFSCVGYGVVTDLGSDIASGGGGLQLHKVHTHLKINKLLEKFKGHIQE
jgi:hypothetical protein